MIKRIFSDFDGTLTLDHSLSQEFFELLSLLDNSSINLTVVTGRPSSWGVFLLTYFKTLNEVICENGAVNVIRSTKSGLPEVITNGNVDLDFVQSLRNKLAYEFPQIRFSADTLGRLSDVAIELESLNKEELESLLSFARQNNYSVIQSNVHLHLSKNSSINKYTAIKDFSASLGLCLDHEVLYFGDSFNDESVFQHLKNTVGVSNIRLCLEKLTHPPAQVLDGDENREILGVLGYLKSAVLKIS